MSKQRFVVMRGCSAYDQNVRVGGGTWPSASEDVNVVSHWCDSSSSLTHQLAIVGDSPRLRVTLAVGWEWAGELEGGRICGDRLGNPGHI